MFAITKDKRKKTKGAQYKEKAQLILGAIPPKKILSPIRENKLNNIFIHR
jgi:hypothetical protein